MRNKNSFLSAISLLTPTVVWDVKTGAELSLTEWSATVGALLTYVQQESSKIYESDATRIKSVVSEWRGSPQPAEFARRNSFSLITPLPVQVKAQSRVERLVRYNLITAVASHTHNPNPRKQEPGFPQQINLGAVDKQMASLSVDGDTLYLLWKVWDKELLLEFAIPGYVLTKRRVDKWCLPTVQLSKKTGQVMFGFTYEETFTPNPTTHLKAGVDLGRKVVYTTTVLNENDKLVAQYYPSPRLAKTNRQREALLAEKKHVQKKLAAYEALNTLPEKQERLKKTCNHLAGKIRRLGNEVAHKAGSELAQKLEKHALNTLNMENLAWVHGAKYGGRWNHSLQQEAITHSMKRAGVRVKKVNPKNTSQSCYKCGSKLTHSTVKRSVHCSPCKTVLDRDFNAALNITKNNTYPDSKRLLGDDRSVKQVVEPVIVHSSDSQEPT